MTQEFWKFGLRDLDRLANILPGSLMVVASRQTNERDAFAITVANNIGVQQAKPILYFTGQVAHQLTRIFLSSSARVDVVRFRDGLLIDRDFVRLADIAGGLAEAQIAIVDDYEIALEDIERKARFLLNTVGPLGLIVFDDLHRLQNFILDTNENFDLSRELKILARKLNTPILLLADISSDVENRISKRPTIADIIDSDTIESDADLVLLIHREELFNPHTDKIDIAEIIVAKQRNGPTGSVELHFSNRHLRFNDLAKDEI